MLRDYTDTGREIWLELWSLITKNDGDNSRNDGKLCWYNLLSLEKHPYETMLSKSDGVSQRD